MNYFLASQPIIWKDRVLNPKNQFVETLKSYATFPLDILFVSADPTDDVLNDRYQEDITESFQKEGFVINSFAILDNRYKDDIAKLIQKANLIFLSGGHVPSQNTFFKNIDLKEYLRDFSGILIASSAGTMNSAREVCAQPELEGEARSKTYQRFLEGLGVTKYTLLPHYQLTKDLQLDGLRIYEDMTYPDSMRRTFYALTDGSYLFGDGISLEIIKGESYKIEDGQICQFSAEGEVYRLTT